MAIGDQITLRDWRKIIALTIGPVQKRGPREHNSGTIVLSQFSAITNCHSQWRDVPEIGGSSLLRHSTTTLLLLPPTVPVPALISIGDVNTCECSPLINIR